MKYTFSATGTISLHVEVEADSLEEAVEKAKEAPIMGLCHQCASTGDEGEWRTSGELDCDPTYSDLTELLIDDEEAPLEFSKAKKFW